MATKTSARRKGGARKSTSRTRSPKTGTKAAGSKRGVKRGVKRGIKRGVKRPSVTRASGSRAATGAPTPERPSKGISRIDQANSPSR